MFDQAVRDFSPKSQLASAPVLASLDTLLIEDLTDDEDDAFAAALDDRNMNHDYRPPPGMPSDSNGRACRV